METEQKEAVSLVQERHLHCDGSDEHGAKPSLWECILKERLTKLIFGGLVAWLK